MRSSYCIPQLRITNATMTRIKEIVGITRVHDGDYLVNEMIDIFEKKINNLR